MRPHLLKTHTDTHTHIKYVRLHLPNLRRCLHTKRHPQQVVSPSYWSETPTSLDKLTPTLVCILYSDAASTAVVANLPEFIHTIQTLRQHINMNTYIVHNTKSGKRNKSSQNLQTPYLHHFNTIRSSLTSE